MENLLGIQFTGADPLAEVAAYGQNMVNAATTMTGWGVVFSGGGGFFQAIGAVPAGATPNSWGVGFTMAGGLLAAIGGLLLAIAALLFTAGFAMAFFVPLIPFLTFFFGSLTWIVSMIEAVIAVPLVALAHLNPEGDGLPGDLARPAYFLIFQMFLRPVLMIFGLIAGLLIFYLGVSLLNALFAIAVAGTGGLSHGNYTIMRLVYTVIYVVLVVSLVNTSFQLIQRLPDTALQWIGMGGLQGVAMGDAGVLEEKTAGVQAYFAQGGMQQLGGSASGTGSALGQGARALGLTPNPVEKPPTGT
jgi:conjugal transfer/type IV secretion protein DotA/TraY